LFLFFTIFFFFNDNLHALSDRIENLETDNPKEYWSLVNQLRNVHSDKPESSIDEETWYKYFSELTSLITYIIQSRAFPRF
jgi:hypothetical protein